MLKKLLVLVITLLIPFLLVVGSIRIVANPWFIQVRSSQPGLSGRSPTASRLEQRTPSGAARALSSVVPEGAGLIELEQAKLPNWRTGLHRRARSNTCWMCAC